MSTNKELAVQYLTEQGYHCKEYDDRAFRLIFTGDNCSDISILILFDDSNSDMVRLQCDAVSNANFNGKEATGLALCNNLNSQYRWVKFYLNEESNIRALVDGMVEPNTCGQEVYRLLNLIVGIIDEAYPDIMRARFA